MAEPKRDILDLLEMINSRLERWESRIDRIERRLKVLVENASPQAPAPAAPIDEEAPFDEPSCEEQCCDDEPSDDDYSQIDEPCEELTPCQIEPLCKPAYEPLRRYIKLSIRRQNTTLNRTQLELLLKPSLFRADDVVDTPGESIIQGVITVDGVSLAC
jgi:hypothetical protein